MTEKIKATFSDWKHWFYSKRTAFSLHMAKKCIGVKGKEKAFNYWIKKAEKYCQKDQTILQLYT